MKVIGRRLGYRSTVVCRDVCGVELGIRRRGGVLRLGIMGQFGLPFMLLFTDMGLTR